MNDLPQYAPLYDAVRRGAWEDVREFLTVHPEAVNARISFAGKTALHVAALFGHSHIVEELLKRMSVEYVEMSDYNLKLTALDEAAFGGKVEVAKCLVKKSSRSLTTANAQGFIPVTRALDVGNEEMTRYLYSVTPLEELTPEKGYHGATLLNLFYYAQMLDMALDLLRRCPRLAVTQDIQHKTFLDSLASIPSAFPSGCQLSFWERWIYKRRKKIYRIKLAHLQSLELLRLACHELSALNEEQLKTSLAHKALLQAAKMGIPEFIIEATKAHVHIFWSREAGGNPFFDAVEFRQARVFRLIHGMIWKDAVANGKDTNGNTLLHMAGLLAPSARLRHISGAALQMQSELQWFKEVDSLMPPSKKECSLNKDQMTARELFTEKHKDSVEKGEKWMKQTAGSCSVVAALVATIMFAAAFTVPGSNDQKTSNPIFLESRTLMLYILSDAISLFSSTTSILMFLGILTSRYAEDDFLKSLPTKLIIGLSTLFISMATMLIAFCAALYVMLDGKAWIVIPATIFASVPVTSFIWLQFPLLLRITMSTYGPSIFDRNVEQWLS